MKLDSKLLAQTSFVRSNLPIISASILGSVVCYYAGYFFWAAGFAIPPIDVQDLSLSSVVLVSFALIISNIWQSLELGDRFDGVIKYILFAVVFCAFVWPTIYRLWQVSFDFQRGDAWTDLFWLLTTTAILFGAIVLQFAKTRISEFSNREVIGMVGLSLIVVWLFGIHAFFSDLSGSKPANLYIDEKVLQYRVLRVMSSVVVAFNPVECKLVLLNRSNTMQIEFEKPSLPFDNSKFNFDCFVK